MSVSFFLYLSYYTHHLIITSSGPERRAETEGRSDKGPDRVTGQTGGFVVHSVATLVIHCLTLRLTRPSFTLFASRLSTGPSLVSLRYSRYTPYARLRLTPSPTGSEVKVNDVRQDRTDPEETGYEWERLTADHFGSLFFSSSLISAVCLSLPYGSSVPLSAHSSSRHTRLSATLRSRSLRSLVSDGMEERREPKRRQTDETRRWTVGTETTEQA